MSDPAPPLRPDARFWPIGYFRAELVDDIIHVASSGEFNWECAQQFRHGLFELIGRLPSVFGILSEFDVAPIMTAEVEALMARLTEEGARLGFLASAFVSHQSTGVGIAQAQWSRIYAALGLEIRFFDDTATAQQWLGEKLAQKTKKGTRKRGRGELTRGSVDDCGDDGHELNSRKKGDGGELSR